MLGLPSRSVPLYSSAASDVEKRQVGRLVDKTTRQGDLVGPESSLIDVRLEGRAGLAGRADDVELPADRGVVEVRRPNPGEDLPRAWPRRQHHPVVDSLARHRLDADADGVLRP